ncbi:endonuclease/exonuclease/phosphatase family protein [Actinotalea ferrariae]|uniref:endonuclease/exonuclease/phosphatase family protein n=1 Tax=Actinotalea ferrariae TaxID=1386098 RepID=UPI001C8BE8E9|nr:endonuclease/exonuclease/phosphatase family protein [Actinotalea ferrariae]MBX9246949.1 endonuclease/exonuclease/phosphatase family protein [Actinotalea ferrariae]
MPSLRVLTYNIHQLRDDPVAVAEILRRSEADVVAVQEPPRGPLGRPRLARLAQAAGYDVAVAGGGARTTALLVRRGTRATTAQDVRLPWRPFRTRRGLAMADVQGVRVISAHLSLDEAERVRHLRRLVLLVRAAPGGCVVAGDLNEEPGGPTWRRLGLHLHDLTAASGPTFTARRPRRRLDAVLATSGITGWGARRLDAEPASTASDHLPVVVDLRW